MKKILILASIAFLELSSSFGWASASVVPDTALLYATGQVNFLAWSRSDYYSACAMAKDYLITSATERVIVSDLPYYQDLRKILSGPLDRDSRFQSTSFDFTGRASDILSDIELSCQNVYYKWDYRESSSGGIFKDSRWNGSIGINVYCEPREIKQKQILSFERFCEHHSSEKCFDKAYLEYLGKLAPTSYINIDSVNCEI